MGRVVITHSTYLEGLIKSLKKLAQDKKIKTITPSVIGKTKSNSGKLSIRISREINGGFKLLARKGTSYQDIFLIGSISKRELEELINDVLK